MTAFIEEVYTSRMIRELPKDQWPDKVNDTEQAQTQNEWGQKMCHGLSMIMGEAIEAGFYNEVGEKKYHVTQLAMLATGFTVRNLSTGRVYGLSHLGDISEPNHSGAAGAEDVLREEAEKDLNILSKLHKKALEE